MNIYYSILSTNNIVLYLLFIIHLINRSLYFTFFYYVKIYGIDRNPYYTIYFILLNHIIVPSFKSINISG